MAYLPENYPASRETVVFQEALQPEITAVWAARDDLLAQLNPYTATWGLDYWEDGLGIAPAGHLDLGLRRRQIVAKLQGRGPTTAETLKNVAETFLGVPVAVTEVFDEYRVELVTSEGLAVVRDGMARLREQLISILPAHLDFQVVIPRFLLLSVTPKVGPRCSETALARFQGRLPDAPLYVTARGGGTTSAMYLPPMAAGPGITSLPAGSKLGPRLSRTVPNSRLPAATAPMTARTGSRTTATRLPRGAADYEGG